MYWVYIIRNKGNKLYVGVTKNPNSRIYYHNRKRGAQFTQNNPSFNIVFLEEYTELKEARRREIQIKKWRRDKKEMLINLYSKGIETRLP
ncbi:MAG: GIY-YIG nuclease family protein [Patescibacteria group bacterium]